MSHSLKVSKKHGVNPTIPICFWCEKEKNEVAMLGELPNDVEAPKSMWIPGDYKPCDNCQKEWAKGIALIEASTEPFLDSDQPEWMSNAYPTGRYVVVKKEAIEKMFSGEDLQIVKKNGVCFVSIEDFTKLVRG